MMGDVIRVDFGQPDAASPDEDYADVVSIVAELEPTHALSVLSNALFAVLLAKNGRDREARGATCASSIATCVNSSWLRRKFGRPSDIP